MAKKLTNVEFLERARSVHGEKYDYSLVKYCGYNGLVKIICPVHGEFEQKGGQHLFGSGCQRCGQIQLKTTSGFIVDAKKLHGDLYDYSLSNYICNKKHITIICKKHGKFSQTPNSHLRGEGCPICGREIIRESRTSSTDRFIISAKSVHGNKYDYSDVKYIGNKRNITIICPQHGKFLQLPGNHLRGCNCPKCAHGSTSKLEQEFVEYLGITENNHQCQICPEYIVDGYDPISNTVYEFLGDYWHGNPKFHLPEKFNKTTNSTFGKLYEKTFSRFNDISKLGCTVKYIWEADWNEWKKTKIGNVPLETYVPSKSPNV